MSGPDSYYTPPSLADKLVSYICPAHITRAVDFCVGDGDLLKAVAKRYSTTKMFGTDISDDALVKLSNDYPSWNLDICNFRSDESVSEVDFLKDGLFDLVVLNPPFTCKGSSIEKINIEGIDFHVSTAMLFLLRALKYLAPNGGLYAILPISCVYSIKDSKAWTYLKEHYNACILEEPDRISFTNRCAPNIVLVYVGHYMVKGVKESESFNFATLPVTSILRGSVRMQNLKYTNSKKSVPLIHTTNLQKGKLLNLRHVQLCSKSIFKGNGVVIPRVCNPNPGKVVLLEEDVLYALSDCVIVLQTKTRDDAERLRDNILDNWSDFMLIYKGTGAQYTTLARLNRLFCGK